MLRLLETFSLVELTQAIEDAFELADHAFEHRSDRMSETAVPLETPQLLLDHHLKTLHLPTMLREYDRVARQCAAEDLDYPRYLLRVAELELARCEFLTHRENLLLLGNSGTGKTHIALALGLAACQQGHRVRFTSAAALVHELIEARDERKLLHFQKQIASYELLIVDELGFVPPSKTGAELLFEMLSQHYERGSTMLTSNLPFAEWTEVLGS